MVTIGVFDGMHRGHAQLVGQAVRRAREMGVPSVLMTFDPHPSEVVRPGSHPAQLTTLRRRAELVEQVGVEVFFVLPFTVELARMPADEFVHEVLVERLHVAEVVVGDNFTFGHKAAGDIKLLRSLGRRFGFTDPKAASRFILAGGACGIAAAFNTPLAGVVFAIEELAGTFEHRFSGLLLTAVIVGGVVSMGIMGNYSYFC